MPLSIHFREDKTLGRAGNKVNEGRDMQERDHGLDLNSLRGISIFLDGRIDCYIC